MNIDRMAARQGRREPAGSLRWRALVVAFSLLLLASSGPSIVEARPVQQPVVLQEGLSGPVIVLLNDDADSSRVIRESSVAQPQQVYTRVIRGFAADLSAAEVQRLARDPRVRAISPDLPVYAQAQTLPTGVDRIDADRNSVAQIDGNDTRVNVGIAILDSGIDPGHPDLNVAGGVNFVGSSNCAGSSDFSDSAGHGTHVAGIAAAKDNGFGTVGVAPGARLYGVKVLSDSLSGRLGDVICGLDWVIGRSNKISVVNMSFAGTGAASDSTGSCGSNGFHQAICNTVNAGITVVTAAGNFGSNAASFIPATYPEVITVSAFADYNGRPGGGAPANCATPTNDPDDTFAGYSNYGGDVDIVAPGSCIRSTLPGGGTGFKSGTSMASPHVAGAAALYLATSPGASPGAVRSALIGQARSQSSTYGISGDPDGSREPVLYVGGAYAPAPTPVSPGPAPTSAPSTGGRTIRGGGDGSVAPTSTPRPGVPPPPTSAPQPTSPPSTGGRTIRGGGGGSVPPTATPVVSNPPPGGSNPPTATPGGSRTIRGSVAGSSASGDGTGGSGSNRALRGASTATPVPPTVIAAAPIQTPVPPTATVVPPAQTPAPPTATLAPPTETPVPPTATLAPPTETPVPPTATEELLPTETPVPPEPTETPVPTDVPTPSPLAVVVSDNVESVNAWRAIDQDVTTAWHADALPLETANVNDATPGAVVDEPDGVFLELDLGSVVSVGLVRWSFAKLEYADLYEVQISSDGETWQSKATFTNPVDSEWQELYIVDNAQYVRFLFQNPNGDQLLGALSEVEVYAP